MLLSTGEWATHGHLVLMAGIAVAVGMAIVYELQKGGPGGDSKGGA